MTQPLSSSIKKSSPYFAFMFSGGTVPADRSLLVMVHDIKVGEMNPAGRDLLLSKARALAKEAKETKVFGEDRPLREIMMFVIIQWLRLEFLKTGHSTKLTRGMVWALQKLVEGQFVLLGNTVHDGGRCNFFVRHFDSKEEIDAAIQANAEIVPLQMH